MKKIMCVCLAMLFACSLFAQKKDVSGLVIDSEGKPLKGIRIMVLDTKIQVKTNKQGEFVLKSVQPNDTVAVFLERDKGTKFLLGEAGKLLLKIDKEAIRIDNGSGDTFESLLDKQELKEYGSGNMITARRIERNGYLSIKEAIKACIPGVSFQYSESGEERVSIRGSKSLTLSTEPLVVLDGTETNLNTADASCSIHDVLMIEVIKDGLGYGAKGANGVIVIKTKK